MERFEFFMTIAGVAVAIGITEIVGGWGRLLRSDTSLEVDWLHLGWCLILIVWPLQYWIGMWSYREIEFTSIAQVMMLVFPTLLVVLAQYAITPVQNISGRLVLRDYYLAKRRFVFLPFAAFLVMSYLADVAIVGFSAASFDFATGLMLLIVLPLIVSLALFRSVWLHSIGLVFIAAALATFSIGSIDIIEARFVE
jgi:hypothetical protein